MTKITALSTDELIHLLDDLATAIINLYEQAEGKDLLADSPYGRLVEAADNAIAYYRSN